MGIIILGMGGLAKEIWGMVTDIGLTVDGFISKDPPQPDETFMGCPVLGDDHWLQQERGLSLVIANGKPEVRYSIRQKFNIAGHTWPTVVHKYAGLYGKPHVGAGSTVMQFVVIQPDVFIGRFCHVNMGVTIGHDTQIGEFCVINHNAAISGSVTIGNQCLIGANSTIIEGNTIGDGAVVGAGAVVTKNVPPGEIWVGVPAQPIKLRRPSYAELYQIV